MLFGSHKNKQSHMGLILYLKHSEAIAIQFEINPLFADKHLHEQFDSNVIFVVGSQLMQKESSSYNIYKPSCQEYTMRR